MNDTKSNKLKTLPIESLLPDHDDHGPLPGDAQAPTSTIVYYISKLNPLQFHKRGTRGKALLCLAAVCFFWGTTWLASKEGVKHMPALQMAGIRQFIGGLCYVLFFLAKGATWPKGKEWGPVLILSFLNFTVSNGLSTWGVKYISAGLGSVIGSIFPLWLVLISIVFSKKAVHPKTVIGILLGFAGICVIFYDHLSDFLLPDFRFGIFISIASTLAWAVGTIYTKKHAVHFNPYFSLGLQMIISGAALFGFTEASGIAISISAIAWQSWAAIAYLVIFGSIISFIAYLYALQNLPTTQASIYAYINPIVAVLLGWIIFNEKLTPFIVLGVLITLYGVYLVNRATMKQK